MRLLTRYVAARWGMHLAFVTSVMAGIYIAVDTPERLGQGGAAILAKIPLVLTHVLPVAAAVSLLTAFHFMRVGGGVAALRSSGVPWRRILAPAIVAGVLVAALEALLAFEAAPAALAAAANASGQRRAVERPAWVLLEGVALKLGDDGEPAGAWIPGQGETDRRPDVSRLAGIVEAFARRPPPGEATMAELARSTRVAARLGHDPRPESVEMWTRVLMPCALLLLLACAASSVARQHAAWRAALRLSAAFAAGWIGLSVSIQLYLNGAVPSWSIAAIPAALLMAAAVPWRIGPVTSS